MSQTLKPGVYRIRSVDLNHLPPGLGGMFATNNGEQAPVKVDPMTPPFADKQIFDVVADPERETFYKIQLFNSPTFVVPGWAYAGDGVAGEPITIDAPKTFQIQPVEGVECEGIYLIRVVTRFIDTEVRVGVNEDDNNLVLQTFRFGPGPPQNRPVWQFVPVHLAE